MEVKVTRRKQDTEPFNCYRNMNQIAGDCNGKVRIDAIHRASWYVLSKQFYCKKYSLNFFITVRIWKLPPFPFLN